MRRTALLFALAGLVGALVATPVAVYASHQFTDVPDSNVFHNSIDWMKDNGITVGCNPPANTKYCPGDDVTRGQMAAFMKRLSENRVVDAATVEGKSSDVFMEKSVYDSDQDGIVDLLPRAAFNSLDDVPDGADFTMATAITAPGPGILLLSGGVDALNPLSTNTYQCRLRVDTDIVPGTIRYSRIDGPGSNTEEDCTTSGAAMVAAGTYTIYFDLFLVGSSTNLSYGSVWALWVPLDWTGAIPTSITQLSQASPNIDERLTD